MRASLLLLVTSTPGVLEPTEGDVVLWGQSLWGAARTPAAGTGTCGGAPGGGALGPTPGGRSTSGGGGSCGSGGRRPGAPLVGVCPQSDVLWDEITPAEHLVIYGHIKGLPPSQVTPAAAQRACTHGRARLQIVASRAGATTCALRQAGDLARQRGVACMCPMHMAGPGAACRAFLHTGRRV